MGRLKFLIHGIFLMIITAVLILTIFKVSGFVLPLFGFEATMKNKEIIFWALVGIGAFIYFVPKTQKK